MPNNPTLPPLRGPATQEMIDMVGAKLKQTHDRVHDGKPPLDAARKEAISGRIAALPDTLE